MVYYKEYVRNESGLMIVRCCASCKHHLSDPQREHICQCSLHHVRRRLDDACGDHELNDRKQMFSEVSMLTLHAKPSGKIKKPEYIRFMQAQLEKIDGDSMSQNDFAEMINNLRTTWEKLNGSRYLSKW